MVTITHKFVSSKPDGADSSLLRPSNWNDTHNLNMASSSRLLGRISAGAGLAEEISISTGLEFNAGALRVKASEVTTSGNITTGLGYTPVQQGKGAGQAAATAVKIGFATAGTFLLVEIGSTDYGSNWPINIAGAANKLRSGGVNAGAEMTFTWAIQSTTPAHIWGSDNLGALNRPYDITAITVGNASKLGGVAAANYAQFSTSSSAAETNLPVGSVVAALSPPSVIRRAIANVYLHPTNSAYYQTSDVGAGPILAGSFRQCGQIDGNAAQFQRVL